MTAAIVLSILATVISIAAIAMAGSPDLELDALAARVKKLEDEAILSRYMAIEPSPVQPPRRQKPKLLSFAFTADRGLVGWNLQQHENGGAYVEFYGPIASAVGEMSTLRMRILRDNLNELLESNDGSV